MISSLRIEGFRGFDHFEMPGLGRVNLLVGMNNSGKTSVLEAVYLLATKGDPQALWQLLWRRGERRAPVRHRVGDASYGASVELEPTHLFRGHEATVGAAFGIGSDGGWVRCGISEDEDGTSGQLVLEMEASSGGGSTRVPMTREGTIIPDSIVGLSPRYRRSNQEGHAVQFLSTESVSIEALVGIWNQVALTANETLVLKALQALDPGIERIAAQVPVSGLGMEPSRGGFIVKKRGLEQPVPIGSMGDGMWRILAMALAITQCRGGVLLVDEIDTGLHYTAMSQMWRLIYQAAKDLDVQVFATTHSYDCIYSLAQICDGSEPNAVTVQRIEAGKKKAVPYDQEEIDIAASRQIELR